MFCARRPFISQVYRTAATKNSTTYRSFITTLRYNMPEALKPEEVNSKTDPSVAKQYDESASLEQKTKDLYAICDGLKIGILGTYRPGVGVRPHTIPPTPCHPY